MPMQISLPAITESCINIYVLLLLLLLLTVDHKKNCNYVRLPIVCVEREEERNRDKFESALEYSYH